MQSHSSKIGLEMPEDEELKCLPHKKKAEYIKLKRQQNFKDSLLCSQCHKEQKLEPFVMQQYDKVQYCVKSEKKKMTDNLQQQFDRVEDSATYLEVILETIIKNLQETKCILVEWKKILKDFFFQKVSFENVFNIVIKTYEHINQWSFEQNVRQLFQEKSNQLIEQLKQDKESIVQKIKQKIQKHSDDLLSFFAEVEDFKKLLSEKYQELEIPRNIARILQEPPFMLIEKINQIKQDRWKATLQYKEIQSQEIFQEEICNLLAFNHDATIIAASCHNFIKLWRFEQGKIKDILQILKGHSNNVQCIVFSKKKNWFMSTGLDSKIILWKQIQNQWINFIKDKSLINCLLLNSNESQLICGCCDGKILLFNIDYDLNRIDDEYIIDTSTDYIFSLAFNQQNTLFASCSRDQQLNIWRIDSKQSLPIKIIIKRSYETYGNHIWFVNDDTLAQLESKNGHVHFFQITKNEAKEREDHLIKIAAKSLICPFPQIQLNESELLITIFGECIHFFLLRKDGIVQSRKKLELESPYIYGGYTERGKYLVIWDEKTKFFSTYQLVLL